MLRRYGAVGALVAILANFAVMAEPSQAEYRLSIGAQPMDVALNEFARQSGLQVILQTDEVKGMTAPRVEGTFTARDALGRLLENSGLEFEYLNDRTVAVRAKGSMEAAEASLDYDGAAGRAMRLAQAEASTQGTASEPVPNGADAGEPKLEEVVVTAQKRQERALDVPISITALDGQQLEEFRIRDTQDLSYYVPSLSVAEIGPGMGQIAIRGLGSERGNSSLTGVYLDEAAVAVSTEFPVDIAPVDLERVEVLKGPQGTLYGEGSTGGTLRFITRAPDLTDYSARAELSIYDTEDGGVGEELTGVFNAPLVEDKLGVRVAAYVENGSGWIDRPAANREDINDNDLVDVRTKMLWRPVEALDISGMVVIHRNEAGSQNVVNLNPRSESNFLTEVDPLAPTDVEDDYDLYNLTATYDFGAMSLLSTTSYLEMDKLFRGQSQLAVFDFGGVVLPFALLAREWVANVEVFSQELRLSSSGETRLDWTLGGFYRDSEIFQDRTSDLTFGGAPVGQSGGPGLNGSESWAAFGDASYDLTDRVRFGVGLRYFHDDRQTQQSTPGAPLAIAPLLEGSFDNVSSRVYVSYALSKAANIYLSRAEGFRSGGFNDPASVLDGAPPDFEPEVLVAYELGTKMSLLDGQLSAELALFFNDFTDIQYLGIAGEGIESPFTSNSGKAEMKGFDWSLRWRAGERLTLGFSGDVIDTEVTELNAANTAQEVGDPIDFVSDYSLSVSADYGFKWSDRIPGVFRLAYNQKGPSTNTSRSIGLLTPQDKSDTLRFLNAEVGATFGRLTFGVFGQNLLDEDGKLRPGISAWHAQARPRTFGVRFGAEF